MMMEFFYEIQDAEQTEPDHDQPEQRSSDEEDIAGKKKCISFPSTCTRTGIKCKD